MDNPKGHEQLRVARNVRPGVSELVEIERPDSLSPEERMQLATPESIKHQGRKRQDKLEALMDETSPAQIAEMLEAICREKAQHLAVNWQDNETATMWERHARVFGNAAIRAHGIGNPYGGA